MLMLGVGLLIGLLLGGGVVLGLELADPSLKTVAQAQSILDVPVVGVVPKIENLYRGARSG
jgi:capsular polysaccharide biosynthesis protein